MDGLREEPTTNLLSEMEGIPGVWDEAKQRWGIRLQRNLIPGYATADFWEAVQMWTDWKEFGFPCAGGTQDQPALWLIIVRLFQSCFKKLEEQ
ncbi:MAG: hypothetical protein ACOYB0_09680 [Polynucleobacter sp.]